MRLFAPEQPELRHHLGMVHDRSGDQLRKKENEQREIGQPARSGMMCVNVGEIGDLLKGEERYSKRQDDVQKRQLGARDIVQSVDEEIRVFEIDEQREIAADAGDEKHLPRWPLGALDRVTDIVICQHRGDQQDEKVRAPPRVKQHRRGEQP